MCSPSVEGGTRKDRLLWVWRTLLWWIYQLLLKVTTQQTFVLMKMSWRRLEDVFRLRLQKTSSRRLQDVLIQTNMFALALRLQKTSSKRLEDVLVKTNIFVLAICLQDVFKTSSRRLQDMPSRRLQHMSSRRLQDMSSRRFEDVFKMSSSHFQGILSS